MDLQAEDLRSKSNNFTVHPYNSLEWKKMEQLGVFTIKELQLKELSTTSGEDSNPAISPKKKKKVSKWNKSLKMKS